MALKDDIIENLEAGERAAAIDRSLAQEAQKLVAGDPIRLALDARLKALAQEWAIVEGLADLRPLEDGSRRHFSMAAE
jgi:hypothetical protein